jgi:hypothetical protein
VEAVCEVVRERYTGVAVEVAYVCMQPMIAVDVAVFEVVSVNVPPAVGVVSVVALKIVVPFIWKPPPVAALK